MCALKTTGGSSFAGTGSGGKLAAVVAAAALF